MMNIASDARPEGFRPEGFYIGHEPAAPVTRRFMAKVAAGVIASAFALALALGFAVQEPGKGGYGADLTAQGVLQNVPYPVLRIAPSADHPKGRALLVAGDGKIGAGEAVETLKGQVIEATGNMLKRGDLDMMIVDTSTFKPVASAAPPKLAEAVPLGKWRIAGEICDGKCYAGAMRPGTGLAHKACANLCITGGQAAILATSKPVEGASFLLLANADGSLPPARMYDLVALPVELEGELFRLDDLLIFRVNWQSAKTL